MAIRAMEWTHNDQWMLSADHDGFIKYWQNNMNNVTMFQAHKEAVRAIRFVNVGVWLLLVRFFLLLLVFLELRISFRWYFFSINF